MKLKIVFTIFMFLSFLSSKNSLASEIEGNQNQFDFNLQYIKSTELIDSKNILDKKFKEFPKSESFGISNGNYWFKLTLTKVTNNLIFYVPTHNIDKIDVFIREDSGLSFLTTIGNSVIRDNLKIDTQFPSFLIEPIPGEKIEYYLRVNFIKEANFPVKFFKEKEFLSYTINKKITNSLYYGTCIIIVLLNLFFFFKLKDSVYLFYSLFLMSLMTNFLAYDGSLIHLFRGNKFYYNLELIIHTSSEVWFLLFSIKFFNLHKKNLKATKLFFIFPFMVVFLYACYFSTKNFTFIAISDAIGISLLPILWFYGIYNIKKIEYAKFYVFGYLLLIPLSVFFIVGYPFGFWKVNGHMLIVKIASWLDIIVFSYAISYRVKVKLENHSENILELKQLVEEAKIVNLENNSTTNPYLSLLKENTLSINPLTLREIDILKYLNEDNTNKMIGEKLYISNHTVKSHLRNIYKKMNVNNRSELKIKLAENKI